MRRVYAVNIPRRPDGVCGVVEYWRHITKGAMSVGLDMSLYRTGRIPGWTEVEYDAVSQYVRQALNETTHQLVAAGASGVVMEPQALDLEAATGLAGANALRPCIQDRGASGSFTWYSIFEEVAYWSKVNAVHAWLVNAAQDGVDECQTSHPLTREQLVELRDRAKLVIAARPETLQPITRIQQRMAERAAVTLAALVQDPRCPFGERQGAGIALSHLQPHRVAELLLPPQGGFFFGDTAIDGYYYDDMADTVKKLDTVLAETDFDTQVVFYQSSW